MLIGALLRFRARARLIERSLAAIARRERHAWLDNKRALIAEFIDDDLRHQHARDGMACPICGVPAGAECCYRGIHAGPGLPPPLRTYPGKVHTRRLTAFHADGRRG